MIAEGDSADNGKTMLQCRKTRWRNNYRIALHISHIFKTRGATYMRDAIIMEVNGQQSLDIQARLIHYGCDLYASVTYMRSYTVNY